MIKISKNKTAQHGQTLIETLVACFILVMGITSALALATYSLGATGNIKQQIIGMGLAREGIEVVKNMRDTNWLRGTLSSECHNFIENDNSSLCYLDWTQVDGGYNISGEGGTAAYALRYESRNLLPWSLYRTDKEYGLSIVNSDRGVAQVYYNNVDGATVDQSNSGFARKISITEESIPPFDQNTGPRLKISSQVWWSGKNCELTADVNPDKSCSVTLETYLTNWRVF